MDLPHEDRSLQANNGSEAIQKRKPAMEDVMNTAKRSIYMRYFSNTSEKQEIISLLLIYENPPQNDSTLYQTPSSKRH